MEMAPHHARGTFTDVRYIQLPITNRVRTNYVVLKINEHQNKMTYREASYFNPAHTSETLINVIFLCPSVCLPVCLYIFSPWVGFSLISLLVWTELKNITEDGIKSKSMLAFLSHTNSAIHSKKNALHILWNLAKKN